RDVVEQAHEIVAVTDQRAGLQVFPECGDRGNAALEQGFGPICGLKSDGPRSARRGRNRPVTLPLCPSGISDFPLLLALRPNQLWTQAIREIEAACRSGEGNLLAPL